MLFDNFQGERIDSFTVGEGEEILALAFAPNDNLTISTNTSKLITLTTAGCPLNTSLDAGNCVCNPSFVSVG